MIKNKKSPQNLVEYYDCIENTELRIALFVDADNISLKHLDTIMPYLTKRGIVTIRRAFGRWNSNMVSEQTASLANSHAMELMYCPNLTKGKNAVDMRMTIDVVNSLYKEEIDIYVLATDDCDFSPLIHHLRRNGKEVWGMGETPAKSIKEACSEFHILENTKSDVVGKSKKESTEENKKKIEVAKENKIRARIVEAIELEKVVSDGGWRSMSSVAHRIQFTKKDRKLMGCSVLNKIISKYVNEAELSDDNTQVRLKSQRSEKKENPVSEIQNKDKSFTEENVEVLKSIISNLAAEAEWFSFKSLRLILVKNPIWLEAQVRCDFRKKFIALDGIFAHPTNNSLFAYQK